MKVIEVNCATGEQTTRDMTASELMAVSNTPQPTPDPKLTGIEFDGVMCSATSADAAGLLQVKAGIEMMGANFKTKFLFANGNALVITAANFTAFMQVWVPFRQSFFAVDE